MEIRESSFNFPRSREDGAQSASQTVTFPRAVSLVAVGITGYSATFEDDDHELGRLTVETNAVIDADDATRVNVTGTFGLRDWSGEFDDFFSGNIQWALLAELVPVPTPSPGDARADLLIVGAEVSQCIQHFRSAKHLDAANVFPDNSIRLVADKPAAVRLYVDYDASSGLPLIAWLNGELIVTSGTTTMTIPALQSMRPRRDVSTDRKLLGHTVNFLIPESLCTGAVAIEARVFDLFSPADQFSQTLRRDLVFEAMPDLPVMAVGIEYTGDDTVDGATPADLAAPLMSDFVGLFDFTERIFPIPEVTISSYQTMTYDDDVESDISEGCDKIGDLKDAVADLRGDSDDIVYGLFNVGLNTGSVGGCGSDGVAVGRIGAQGTAAHELGHALGRQHAPCDNVTRCAEPRNQDDDYPSYAGFDSDSIGEYGFDTRAATGSIVDPANAHDVMGYSGGRWISPYNYKALMSRIPADFGGGAAALSRAAFSSARPSDERLNGGRRVDNEWIPVKTPQLFLRFDIARDRSIRWQAAFHFDALPRPHSPTPTDFVLEQLDKKANVLRSACLYADALCCSHGCGGACECESWPVRIRHAVAFAADAAALVLYECDKEIQRWDVPAAPKVDVECEYHDQPDRSEVVVRWNAKVAGDTGKGALWFLVQWRDRLGTWRGCGPRTQSNEMRVPKRLLVGDKSVHVRVLASSGIATGVGVWSGDLVQPPPQPGEPLVQIVLQGVPAGNDSVGLPAVVRASVVRSGVRTAARSDVRWYDERGAEIGRGHALDLRALPFGQSVLTAAVLDRGEGNGEGQWLIERTVRGDFRLLRGTIGKKPKERDCREPEERDHYKEGD